MTWPVLKLVIKPFNWFNWRTTEPAVKQYLGSPYCRTSYLQWLDRLYPSKPQQKMDYPFKCLFKVPAVLNDKEYARV